MKRSQMAVKIIYQLFCVFVNTALSFFNIVVHLPHAVPAANSCTQYSLHTQYMLLTHADDLLCLQLHTVQSPYTVHASNTC